MGNGGRGRKGREVVSCVWTTLEDRREKKCVENNSLWAHILQSAQFAEKSGGESEIKKWNSLFDFLESGKKWNM